MIFFKKKLIVLVIFFLSFGLAFAASDSFNVSLDVINNDVIPPDAPTGLTGVALSNSEISLSWTDAVDNIGISQYKIYREGVLVGATSNTSYIDSGLSSGTEYEYYVVAVDLGANISDPSNTVTVLTEAAPVVEPPEDDNGRGSSGGRVSLLFKNFEIQTFVNGSQLLWETTIDSSYVIKYGLSPDHELQSIVNEDMKIEHMTFIDNLLPGTKYYFEVEAKDRLGFSVKTQGEFYTKDYINVLPPKNVNNFNIYAEGDDLILNWKNPNDSDFQGVRIMRSDIFFPSDLKDGLLVYDGSGESFRDTDVETNKVYYYTIFAYDLSKNYSSGVIGSGSVLEEDVVEVDLGPFHIEDSETPVQIFDEGDIGLYQEDEKLEEDSPLVYQFNSGLDFLVRIPATLVEQEPKLIIVTITNPQDPSFVVSQLARLNSDGKNYETVINAPKKRGIYNVIISFVDSKNKKVDSFQLNIVDLEEKTFVNRIIDPIKQFIIVQFWAVLLVPFILLLIIILLLVSGRKRKEER